MKNFTIKTLAVLVAASASSLCAGAATQTDLSGLSRVQKDLATVKPVRQSHTRKPWSNPGDEISAKMRNNGKRNAQAVEPVVQFEGISDYDFLDAPDGTNWFYTTELETKLVETGGTDMFGNPFTEEQITAYTFHIYDNTFTKIGTIHDEVRFAPGETRVASVSIDPAVTTKFFNYDDKAEVMVYLAMNTSAENNYQVNYRNNVYAINGEKDENGNDKILNVFPGRCVDAINISDDSWSEYFYLTFVEDLAPEGDISQYPTFLDFVSAYKTRLTTYTKAGWNGGPSVIAQKDIHNVNMPGDTTDGIYFISKKVGNRCYFFYSMYEKPYFLDPTGFATDESATPDNNFIIEAFIYDGGSELKPVSTTKIPVDLGTSATSVPYTFYSIGSLAWQQDIDVTVNGTPEAPAYIVARDFTTAANLEDVTTDFAIYGNDGKEIKTLAKDLDGVVLLSDVHGFEPQAIFLNVTNNQYTLNFVDLYSGETVFSTPQVINGESISVSGDRVATSNGYKYAFTLMYDTMDNDKNQYVGVMWLNGDGSFDRIDRIKVGKNVARAQVNMWAPVLNPYLYDTDPEMEYAVLIGRYTGDSATEVLNEFNVIDHDGTPMAVFTEDAEKGSVYMFTVIFDKQQNRLQMVYQKDFTEYAVDIYELPFTMMAGGDGTVENPYQIASVGDLQMIKAHPKANYVIINDFDADGYVFNPIETFGGTLDGGGHHIANLVIADDETYTGLFGIAETGSTIKNITFIDPVIRPATSTAGLVAGWAREATLENIRVYGLKTDATDANINFGGIAGLASVNATFNNCGVFKADIDMSQSNFVGGIVGTAQTGVKINACAFSGVIKGNVAVGGIVGQTRNSDAIVTNCHVDADIAGRYALGGIIGSSARHEVSNNYVEGTLSPSAMANPANGYCTGGVIGELMCDFEEGDEVFVKGNVVALTAINVPEGELQEKYPGQLTSVHRIVGYSSINECDSFYGPDGETKYGDNYEEKGLADNYALASLSIFDSKLEAAATTPEGASIDKIERVFLDETLGWQFGETTEAPWHKYSDNDPWLFYESSFIITPSAVLAEEGSKFVVTVRFLGDEELTVEDIAADLVVEYDKNIVEMTGNADMTDNVMLIEFEALKIGKTNVEIKIGGQSSTGSVEVVEKGALGGTGSAVDITADTTVSIKFDGRNVTAPEAYIEVYTLAGVKVGAGRDRVALDNASKGIYVAVATDNAGNRSILKIAL